jgi:preprotein translocase subunit SecD
MNDDLEPQLRDALHAGSLPPAPAGLREALERVPDAPVRLRKRRGAGPILGIFAAAAILVVASAVLLTAGSTPKPGLTAPSAQTPAPSATPAGVAGLHLEYTAQTVDGVAPTPADMAKIASVLHARVDAMGVADPTVATHDLVIAVDLPGITDASDVETVGRLLGQTGKVDFVPLGQTSASVGDRLDLTSHPPIFGGDQIAKAAVSTDQNGQPGIELVLEPDGRRLLADYTASHIGDYFAITLDQTVVTAPVIEVAIPGGDVQITGGGPTGFDATQAHAIVSAIASGALPVPIALTSSAVLLLPSAEPSDAGASPGPERLHLELAPSAPGPGIAELIPKAVAILQTRIANAGVVGATVEAQGTDRIVIELPGVTSSDDPLAVLLPRTGRVNLVEMPAGQIFDEPIDPPINPAVNPPVLAVDAVESVTESVDQAGVAVFAFVLSPDAADAFAGYAAAHLGSSYAITLDRHLVLEPVKLRDLRDGVLTLTADGTVVDRSDPAVRANLAVLQAGRLPLDLKVVDT